jgi:hypothetical protein
VEAVVKLRDGFKLVKVAQVSVKVGTLNGRGAREVTTFGVDE